VVSCSQTENTKTDDDDDDDGGGGGDNEGRMVKMTLTTPTIKTTMMIITRITITHLQLQVATIYT
jgi:hypothetical protein